MRALALLPMASLLPSLLIAPQPAPAAPVQRPFAIVGKCSVVRSGGNLLLSVNVINLGADKIDGTLTVGVTPQGSDTPIVTLRINAKVVACERPGGTGSLQVTPRTCRESGNLVAFGLTLTGVKQRYGTLSLVKQGQTAPRPSAFETFVPCGVKGGYAVKAPSTL
jgi:hypothetical protein